MKIFDTFKPIPVICGYCSKEFSSSTIVFHQKKHHPDLPQNYSPEKIQCHKCLEPIKISAIFFHNTTCDKRPKKTTLLTITEEKDGEKSSCRYCNRKFTHSRISKHESACEYASKKRPIFDILKKRLPYHEDTKSKKKLKKSELSLKYPNSKWQKQHLQLLKNLRVESQESFHEDFIPCPHCSRRFAPVSADKHIDICKNIFNKPRPPPSVLASRLPSLRANMKPLTGGARSSKSLCRPFSVMPKSNEGFNESPDNSCLIDISPGRLEISQEGFKETLSSVRDFKSLGKNRRMKRRQVSREILKQLRPSRTVKEILGNVKEKPVKGIDGNRSHSTQRINEMVICGACGAAIPAFAKFCSMCGVIRVSSRNLS